MMESREYLLVTIMSICSFQHAFGDLCVLRLLTIYV